MNLIFANKTINFVFANVAKQSLRNYRHCECSEAILSQRRLCSGIASVVMDFVFANEAKQSLRNYRHCECSEAIPSQRRLCSGVASIVMDFVFANGAKQSLRNYRHCECSEAIPSQKRFCNGVYDINGRLLKTHQLSTEKNIGMEQIDVSDLPNGSYILSFGTSGIDKYNKQFIINR